VSAVTCGLPDC